MGNGVEHHAPPRPGSSCRTSVCRAVYAALESPCEAHATGGMIQV